MKKKILIVENNLSFAEGVKNFLQMSNFDITIETDGVKGEKLALSGVFDMLLLNIKSPGRSGYEICRRYRERFMEPVILIADKKDENELIEGFSLGADDYLVQPISVGELFARVTGRLNRFDKLVSYQRKLREKDSNMIEIGSLCIDRMERRVFVDGIEKELTPKEYDLLYCLASEPNHFFTTEELYKKVWGMSRSSESKVLMVHIHKIRDKIEKDPANPRIIVNSRNRGYRIRG